ncbi:hypothetical protein FG379_001562 [Cryptosporidium bovis]|uniref:uncharacterized protein n=1 Tax=Cryptosporidium bovis TaxID=310047 RepID=UPI00351A2C94|nr:hypothetical protein FG379_001562 [Cryptosporidium bovis]
MWYIGISTALLSSISGGLGDNLIRLSYILEDELVESERRPVLLRPVWLIGTFLSCILNAILIIISLNYTSAMVVTPFSGLHIFWSIIFSRYLLNEETKNRHYKGTFVVILGLLLVVIFGVKDVPAYTIYELERLYMNPIFVMYCLINISLIVICMYVSFFGIVRDLMVENNENVSMGNELSTNDCRNNACGKNVEINLNNLSSGDVIIVNKNALHLKISNIKNIISKGQKKELNAMNSYKKVSEEYCNKYEISDNHNEDKTILYCNQNIDYNNDDLIIPNNVIFDETDENLYMNKSESNRNANDVFEYYKHLVLRIIIHFDNKVKAIKEVIERRTSNFPRIYVKLSVKRFCMCLVSGLCGGYTNILVQNLINVILLNGRMVLLHLLFYYLVIMIFILTCVQWLFWNSCLSSYQAIYVVPIINSVLIASSGFCNLILYYNIMNNLPENIVKPFNKFNTYANVNQIYFLIGQFFIISGIYIISNKNMETLGDSLLFLSKIKSKLEELNHLKDYIKSKNGRINSSLENLLGICNKKMNINSNDIRVYSQELASNKSNSYNIDSGVNTNNYIYSCNNDIVNPNNNNNYFNNTIILPQEIDHKSNTNLDLSEYNDCEYERNDNDVAKKVDIQADNLSQYIVDDLSGDEYKDYCKVTDEFEMNTISNDFNSHGDIIELDIDSEIEQMKNRNHSDNNSNISGGKTSVSTIDTNSSILSNDNLYI